MFRLVRRSDCAARAAILVVCLGIVGCTSAPVPQPSVYEQLGGEVAVRRIVNDFTILMARDERVSDVFAFTDWRVFRQRLHSFLCRVAGGDCPYDGADMAMAHRGIGISHAEFNVSVELLQVAMTRNDIPLAAQNRLLALLAPMREDIVHR